MLNRIKLRVIAPTGAIAVLLVLTTTRFGVFIVFDILGDIGSDNLVVNPEEGPLRIDRTLSAVRLIVTPDQVEQISGLHIDATGIYASTDQVELFHLQETGELQASHTLISGPLLLRQGSLEGIALRE